MTVETSKVSFTSKDVMALRQKTGLGMMDCKEALTVNNGDMKAAEEWLRAKLKGKMDTRTERPTAEGRIGIAMEGSKAAIVEIRTETDFTAKNESFEKMVASVAKAALAHPAGTVTADAGMTKMVDDVRITTGENVNFAHGDVLEGGTFGSYLHHDRKRGALIQVEGPASPELLAGICMHIVAHVPPPIAVSADDMPQDVLEKVKADGITEAKESGKPEQIAAKIAEGKVRKFLEENTLLDQIFVKDQATPIKNVLPAGVKVKRFLRYTVGAD